MAQEMSPEMFAAHTGIKLSTVKSWINGRGGWKFDHRDCRHLTRDNPLIAVAAPNASGLGARPRLVHVSGRAAPVDVVAQEDGAAGGVPHPAPEDVHGDIPLGVVGGEGVPQAFQVHHGEAR